jgi:hypothetical protein
MVLAPEAELEVTKLLAPISQTRHENETFSFGPHLPPLLAVRRHFPVLPSPSRHGPVVTASPLRLFLRPCPSPLKPSPYIISTLSLCAFPNLPSYRDRMTSCYCLKSGCLSKHCACVKAGKPCGTDCGCLDCGNSGPICVETNATSNTERSRKHRKVIQATLVEERLCALAAREV